MVVNDNAGRLTPRGALAFIASKLAPTEEVVSKSLQTKTEFLRAAIVI
jgi:2-dehydro-3-deoxygluconokinase